MAQSSRSTTEDLYEQQIRPLPVRDRLELAQRIIAEIAAAAAPEGRSRSLLELEGLGAELWGGMDAQEFVNQLRNEWDDRS
jgi:hypothetical protein